MGIPENIDALLVKYDINQDCLARVAGVAPSAVTRWRQGAWPRKAAIENICEHFGLEEDDLLSEKVGLAAKEHGLVPANAIPVSGADMVAVPLRGRVHAGKAAEPEDLDGLGKTVMVPRFLLEADPDSYACESEGDCMDNVYPEGCIIVVSPNRQPQNGSVAVVTIDGSDAVMRRMYRTPNTLVLSPDSHNPEHKDIVITSDEDHTVTFGGKVVWFQAKEEMG